MSRQKFGQQNSSASLRKGYELIDFRERRAEALPQGVEALRAERSPQGLARAEGGIYPELTRMSSHFRNSPGRVEFLVMTIKRLSEIMP
jgi:hypothetical protein